MNPFNVTVKNPETNKENVIQIEEYQPSEGRGKEKMKLRPVGFDQWNLQKAIDTWGAAKVWDVVASSKLMQFFTVYTDDATTRIEVKDGKEIEVPETDEGVIQKKYSDRFEKLSRRGESLQALTRRANEIVEAMAALADLIINGKTVNGQQVPLTPDENQKSRAQLNAYKAERAELLSDIADIKKNRASSKDEGDGEEVKKAA